MAFDRHRICNNALASLGANSIQSFDQGTTEADLCAQFYELAVREVLEDHPWNFAEKIEYLGAADVVPARPDFTYSYSLPLDCVAPRHILTKTGGETSRGYKLTANRLCTDEESPYLVYTSRAPEQFFSAQFIASLELLLASKLAGPISEDPQRARTFNDLYRNTLPIARSRDSQMDMPESVLPNTLIAVHSGG